MLTQLGRKVDGVVHGSKFLEQPMYLL
jgi:hypothetical protein